MKVSVIVPCRNEKPFIADCLDSILANDYPEKEIIVVDGMSGDGTREVLQKYPIRLLDNPKRITPSALNIGIRNATGEAILWMSAHNQYPPDYISQCVEHLEDADNVGGIIETKGSGPIAAALSHPFGVGNSAFRTHVKEPAWVDTVFGGCYRRDVFDRIGLFNENLVRGQDMEFNRRLKKAGGKILLVPSIVSTYHARSGFLPFCLHNFVNGVWAILPFLYSSVIPVRLRHLVPLLFVLALGVSALINLWVTVGIGAVYILCALIASIHAAVKHRDVTLVATLPFVFPALHATYGLGSLAGILIAPFYRLFRPKV